ncbi:hypothetical protein R3P38DRAFT_2799941 [Favolaschia claudopus]|uniref:Uncharacterized protein n=1 Tax=Favolaschia claudopus TaxID=2862362 RepID=A0AAV9ZZ63_9AGAR
MPRYVDFLPGCAKGVAAAYWKTNMRVGSKRQCGLLKVLSNIYPTSSLATLNFLALRYSGRLKAPLAGDVYPCKVCASRICFQALQNPSFSKSWLAAGCTYRQNGLGIRAEQRDTRSCVRVVEDLIHRSESPELRCIFCAGDFAAGRQKPPLQTQSNAFPPESHELFSSLTKRRAAARSFECTEWDFCCRQAKTAPPNSKRRHHELRCSLMRREAALNARGYRFSSAEQHFSRIPDVFGNFVFSPSGERSSPRAASFSSQTPTSKFKNRFFGVRRAPTLHEKFSRFDFPASRELQCNIQRINRKSSRECEPCANGFILTRQTSDRRNSLMRVFKFRSSR